MLAPRGQLLTGAWVPLHFLHLGPQGSLQFMVSSLLCRKRSDKRQDAEEDREDRRLPTLQIFPKEENTSESPPEGPTPGALL